MAVPTYTFFQWNPAYTYARWDVAFGAQAGDTNYYYSTTNSNANAFPLSKFVYTPVSYSRTENVTRVTFTQTGSIYFQQGSIVVISGMNPDSLNYTGTVLAGGAGYCDYLNPGLNQSASVTAGGVTAPMHPSWTTGMMWISSWQTDTTHNMAVINTQLGENYSQRMNTAINSNSLSWNLTFAERTDKEAMALLTFLQVAGGATPFVINYPVGGLYNMPGIKYISQPAKHQLTSFGLNTIIVPVVQVFDIG